MKRIFIFIAIFIVSSSAFAEEEWHTIHSEYLGNLKYKAVIQKIPGKEWMDPNEKLRLSIFDASTDMLLSHLDIKHPDYPATFYGAPKIGLYKTQKKETLIILEARYGGDGNYSVYFLKVFKLIDSEFKLVLNQNINQAKFYTENTILQKITGKHIETLCLYCDGWMESENKDIFEVPILINFKEINPKVFVQMSKPQIEEFILRLENQIQETTEEQLSYGRKNYPSYAEKIKKRILDLLNNT